jgi:hypothetical protein
MIGLVSVFICTYWNILYNYVDESYSGFVGNLLWIIESGMNPFIYLTMNEYDLMFIRGGEPLS